MTWLAERHWYQEQAQKITPEIADIVSVTDKGGWFWKVAAWALFILSVGQFKRRVFLEWFASSIGGVEAYPSVWTRIGLVLMAHEGGHTLQFLFAGWFVPIFGWLGRKVRVWVGILPMGIVYGLLPLPIGLAWCRYRLELDADAKSWRWGLESGEMLPNDVRERAESFAETVSSWAYLKAWPKSWAVRGFMKRAEAEILRFEQRKS